MTNGGPRPGAGRKPGSRNKKTRVFAEQLAASGLTPLEYLLAVMRNPDEDPALRIACAKAAAPFMHPRLAPAEASTQTNDFVPLVERLKAYAQDDTIEASGGKVVPYPGRC